MALAEANETLACLETALGSGYIAAIAPTLRGELDPIIGTLLKILR